MKIGSVFRRGYVTWAGNKISRAHGNTNIFVRFATAVFATSGQSFVRLKIALNMSQGRELACCQIGLLKIGR